MSTPGWFQQWQREATVLGRLARIGLDRAGNVLDLLDESQCRSLRRVAKTLEQTVWAAPLDEAARQLAELVQRVLDRQDPHWLPDPVPGWVLLAAGVLLAGVDHGGAAHLGARPQVQQDHAAQELLPAVYLDACWQEWSAELCAGKPAKVPQPAELFPGRRAAISTLVDAWQQLADQLADQPGGDHLIAVPPSWRPAKSLFTDAAAQILRHPARKITIGGDEFLLLIVPHLLVRVLARLGPFGPADLGELPATGHATLLEIALGVWDANTLDNLRDCVASVPMLQDR